MKRRYAAALLAAIITAGNTFPTLAGQWQWQDVNGDGISECYYYDDNGNMLTNTTTPDGYIVDSNGAWVVDGVVQTQGSASGNSTGTSVNHNAGYDPAHPLAGKIDEWNLRLPYQYIGPMYICNTNVQAMLTGQMDQYYAAPVGESVNPSTGTTIYTSQEDYNYARMTEQALYNWFCNWLNGMDFENMSEMDKAKEIQKVMAQVEFLTEDNEVGNSQYKILIEKKGACGACAVTATSLAKALGLKSAVSGTGNHAVYYIQVDGVGYFGQNNELNLDTPTPDYVYFQ